MQLKFITLTSFQMARLGILSLLLTQILAAKKPNVLIIIADDLGWNDISLHNPYFHTPNIDSLIKESLHLKNYYVQVSYL